MIEQKVIHTCDAPGCDTSYTESIECYPTDQLGHHLLTPSCRLDGWIWVDKKHYCRNHDIKVSVEIIDRSEPRESPV